MIKSSTIALHSINTGGCHYYVSHQYHSQGGIYLNLIPRKAEPVAIFRCQCLFETCNPRSLKVKEKGSKAEKDEKQCIVILVIVP